MKEDYEAHAQAQLASLKRDMRKTMEDATVRAVNKVMAEFEAKSDERLMENAKGYFERINLVQTGVGIGKPAQQQEPVAYMVKAHGMLQRLSRRADVADEIACQYRKEDPNADVLPLYTSPQAQRTWVGLTDDEILYCVELENPKAIAEEVEAKLRERNT